MFGKEPMMSLDAIAWLTLNPMLALIGTFVLHGLVMLSGGHSQRSDT